MRATHVISLVCLSLVASLGACGNGSTPPPTDGGPPVDLAQLDPPPAGEGLQFGTGDVLVPEGVEEQDCYFFQMKDLEKAGGLDPTQPMNLHRIQVAQRAGSHHMNIFRVKTIKALGPAGGAVQTATNGVGQCFVSSNWSDWPLVANSQQGGQVDWTYPDGVANVIQPDEWLMLQTHYVNASTQTTPEATGHVRVNFWTMPTSQVTAHLGTLFATDQGIRICEHNPKPTFQQGCQFNSPEAVHVIGANGHFHSRGTEFDMYSWDGKTTAPAPSNRFYQSTTWDDPPMLHSPSLDVTIPAHGGIFYSCSFDWQEPDAAVGCKGLDAYDALKHMTPVSQQDCCYTFGPIVDKNEHCNAFVYYYPEQGDANIACN